MENETRILGIGDAHGMDFPNLNSIAKKENIDFIVCTGDLPDADELRDVIFENWFLIKIFGFGVHHFVGLKKFKNMVLKAVKSQGRIIKRLSGVDRKVYLVYGNNDYMKSDVKSYKEFGFEIEPMEKKIKNSKNIILMKKKIVKTNDYFIIGHSGAHSYENTKDKLYKKQKKILSKMLGKKGKGKIFITHEPPFGHLDKVLMRKSPAFGERIGNKLYLELIKKYQPLMHICGHIHEGFGMKKIGKTHLINLGSLQEKNYMIIGVKKGKVAIQKRKIQ